MEHTAPNPDSTVQTTAGFQLDLSKAKPTVAEFIDWDQQFLSRGYAPPEEANKFGTPATWMGKSTGFGTHAHQKMGGAAVPVAQLHVPSADAPRQPQMPGQAPQPVAPQPEAPQSFGMERPMPFAAELLPMMGAMGHPLGVAAGFGAPAPSAAPVSAPPMQAAPIAKSADAGWIDWSGFEAHMAAMMGGQPPDDSGDDAGDSSGEEAPAPAPATTSTTPMGRGTGGTLTYEQTDAEKSLAFASPADALDHLMKGMLAIAQAPLEKAGHKYKSRKRVGGKWVYDYGDQLSLFGSGGGAKPEPSKPEPRKPEGKPRLSPSEARAAAAAGDLGRLFAGDESSGTSTPASAMREIGDHFARAMSHSGSGEKSQMAQVYEREGVVGLRRKLEAIQHPKKLTKLQVDGVMNYAKKRAGEQREAAAKEGSARRAAENEASIARAKARGPVDMSGIPAGAQAEVLNTKHTQKVKDALQAFTGRANYRDAQNGLTTVVRDVISAPAPKSIEGKQAHVAMLHEVSDLIGNQVVDSRKLRDATGAHNGDIWKKRDQLVETLKLHQKHVSARYHKMQSALKRQQAAKPARDAATASRTAVLEGNDADLKSLREQHKVPPGVDIIDHLSRKAARQEKWGKSMTLSDHDQYGRPLSKGLYSFRNAEKDAAMPDEYLYDYLCAFIEEAYEHESREHAHKDLKAEDQLKAISRAIMHELVQTIPQNPNLMRAARKWSVNVDAVAGILVAKGIHRPSADSDWTDDADSWVAMGAPVGEAAMALSLDHATADFDMHARPGIALTARPIVDAGPLMMKSDHADPFEGIRIREAARVQSLWQASEATPVRVAANCPVHNGRDISKAQQLWNPMQPCTCGAVPNTYG